MLHSILVWGATAEARLQKALKLAEDFLGHTTINHPDFILVEAQKSIQISQIRQLQQRLQLKPYSGKVKVALINEADLLTLPAQHSLLKTLEEPPENSIIILTAQTKEFLLTTIISRCFLVSLSEKTPVLDEETAVQQQEITQKILSSTPGERILLAEKYVYNKDQAVDFCSGQLFFWRSRLREKKSLQAVQAIRLIQASLRFLKANVNPRLVVANLLISYPE